LISELSNEDEKFLFEHDVIEIHHPDSRIALLRAHRNLEIVKMAVDHIKSGDALVLDVGCAQGSMGTVIAEKREQASVIEVDINPRFLSYAKNKADRGRLTYVCASADALPFKSCLFDVVIMGELLEHAAFPEELLKQGFALLKPGGILIASTPNGKCKIAPDALQ